jgi:outer membrane biosynthesis protein TonB
MHQRHKLRLDVVLAGVALLVLFSVLPFFFQRIDDFEPDSQSRDLADSLDLTNADASTRGERSLTTSSSSSTPNDEDNEEGLEPLTFAELDDQPAQQLKTHHKRPVIEKEKEEERSPAAPKKQQQKPKKMSNVVVEKASDFEATLDRHFADHADDTVLVYLYGNVQPQTGKSVRPPPLPSHHAI